MQDGNDKSFALYDEVNGALRDDLSQDSGIGDIFGDLEGAAVELLGDSKDFDKKEDESEDLSELDVPAGVLDKSNDSVRVYLREMGMVPLLTPRVKSNWQSELSMGRPLSARRFPDRGW